LKFAELSPSKSVRNEIACIFADIDGFTAYVDEAIKGGSAKIKAAVRTVHVIREELNDVLQDDFKGKRIRFIGDCIHGGIAAGDLDDDDASEAVTQAGLCAAGMASSFDLCLEETEPGADLDLAIGIEYGPVPISRLGTPGDDSVRCAVSRAVVNAERLQQSLERGGVAMGPVALSHANMPMQKAFRHSARVLRYATAADLLGSTASPAIQIIRQDPGARPHANARW
jgi:class 3 adenylate cyclase